jgi:hypothetical protein
MFQFALATTLAALLAADPAQDNPILQELIQKGVTLSNGEVAKIAEPTLKDGLSAEQQKEVVTKLSKRYDWNLFSRKSTVAPFVLEIASTEGKGGVKATRVDVFFIAHGKLSSVTSDESLQKFLGTSDKDKNSLLQPEELLRRKIVQAPDGTVVERFSVIESRLIEKVMLAGVLQSARTQSDQSIVLAWVMDKRFNGDATLPNQWQSITPRSELGPAKVYSAYAAYSKLTALKIPGLTDAMFVEIHWLFEEPYGWFNGRNLLRSKLPIGVQSNVRGFRQKLSRAP